MMTIGMIVTGMIGIMMILGIIEIPGMMSKKKENFLPLFHWSFK
jgi:hypothetical protein